MIVWTILICVISFMGGVLIGIEADAFFATRNKKQLLRIVKAKVSEQQYLDILEEYYRP